MSDYQLNWRCTLGFHAWKGSNPRLGASRRCPRCRRQEHVFQDIDTGSLHWTAAWGTDLSDRIFEVTFLPIMLLFMSPFILLMWLGDKLSKWLHDTPYNK